MNKINELKSQLDKERSDNKILVEKIKRLEKELKEEKNKNILSEKIIADLKKELNKEMEKYNNFKKQIDEKKLLEKKLEKEAKDNYLDTMLEKDKEIKELKLKLSRFPFVLEDGEKLISIIFQSGDQSVHSSIICKNNDKFHKIEELLYEKNPKFAESENFFFLNGKKINRNKTLEQNGIKEDDIILLNTFEE